MRESQSKEPKQEGTELRGQPPPLWTVKPAARVVAW